MKLLIIAYKIEKDKGSEDGTGYNIVKCLSSKIDKITLITRKNNIEKLKSDPEFSNIQLIAVDVPKIFSFYKKKGRGIILYYYLWQIMVGITILKLQKKQLFNVVHQLNFHACWAPHFIFSKAKIVWGPLTCHPYIPYDYWYESKLSFVLEIVKCIVKYYFYNFDPFLKWAIKRTDTILLGHNDFVGSYQNYKTKISILPQAGSILPELTSDKPSNEFNILFVGRFISLKGCVIAVMAVHKAMEKVPPYLYDRISFTLIGEGPLLNTLELLVRKIPMIQVKIIPWIPQPQLESYYHKSNLFLFPSLEGQGLVVAEAMASGCPVLCFDHTGPAIVAGDSGIFLPLLDKRSAINQFSDKITELIEEFFSNPIKYNQRIIKAFNRSQELSWENKVSKLIEYYHE